MRTYGANPCDQNGRLDGGKYFVSTRQQLCDFLNDLARKTGIAKSEINPNGYWATPENIG